MNFPPPVFWRNAPKSYDSFGYGMQSKILIADEPTTAIDVTIQAQIFELMFKLKKSI